VIGPEWLGAHPGGKGFRWGRGLLLLDAWDSGIVQRAILDLCVHAEGEVWPEVAQWLARFTDWEFEGHRPKPLA
jgi:hypothetical protein